MKSDALNFEPSVAGIARAHGALAERAAAVINIMTLRDWFIGYLIRGYEQAGADRGAYGGRLLETLAQRLQQTGFQHVEAFKLLRFRRYLLVCPPNLGGVVSRMASLCHVRPGRYEQPALHVAPPGATAGVRGQE